MYHNNQCLVAEGVRGQSRVAVSSNNVCEIGHSYAPFVCDYVDFLGQLLSAPFTDTTLESDSVMLNRLYMSVYLFHCPFTVLLLAEISRARMVYKIHNLILAIRSQFSMLQWGKQNIKFNGTKQSRGLFILLK